MALRLILFVLAALGLYSGAFAQKLDSFDAHCGDVMVLQDRKVQAHIKVTAAQRDKMNKAAEWHRGQLTAIDQQIQAKKIDPQKTDIRPRINKLNEELKSRVLATLDAKQVRRLREVTLQRVGEAALCDSVVAKRIGMTDAQLKKMRDTFQEGAAKYAEAEQKAVQPILLAYKDKKPKDKAEADKLNQEIRAKMAEAGKKARPQLNAIRDSYRKRMQALLSSSQKSSYTALLGAPYKV